MKQFVVIGCGRFGKSLATNLSELDHEVLLIDNNQDTVDEMSRIVTHAVCADVTVEGTLEALGVQNFDTVIIGISSNLEAAIMATVEAKDLGVGTVIVKVKDSIHGNIIAKVGADRIIIPEKDAGVRLAHNLTSSKIVDYIEVSDEFSLMEVKAPKDWYGESIESLNIRERHGLTIVAIKSKGSAIINPSPKYKIEIEYTLLVVGKVVDIEKLAMATDE